MEGMAKTGKNLPKKIFQNLPKNCPIRNYQRKIGLFTNNKTKFSFSLKTLKTDGPCKCVDCSPPTSAPESSVVIELDNGIRFFFCLT